MSEPNADLNTIKIPPPKSFMDLEDSEKVWEAIRKRYPKVAPLLCEMESVLDEAEDFLINCNHLELLSLENLKCDSSNNLESQKDFEGQETNCHLTCDMETNSFNDMKEIVQVEDSASLTEESVSLNEEMFSKKTALVEFSEHEKPNTEESITYFKKVVETIKRSEDTMMLKDNLENFKNKEPNRKLAEIFPLKVSETASINAWDEVIRKSSESNESLVNEDYLEIGAKGRNRSLGNLTNLQLEDEVCENNEKQAIEQESRSSSELSLNKSPAKFLEQNTEFSDEKIEFSLNYD